MNDNDYVTVVVFCRQWKIKEIVQDVLINHEMISIVHYTESNIENWMCLKQSLRNVIVVFHDTTIN